MWLPSAGISQTQPVALCLVPLGFQERQLQSSRFPVHTCISDESTTGVGPVHFGGCFCSGSGVGGDGIGTCVRVIATLSPLSRVRLNFTVIVFAAASSTQPEIVGPVTGWLPLMVAMSAAANLLPTGCGKSNQHRVRFVVKTRLPTWRECDPRAEQCKSDCKGCAASTHLLQAGVDRPHKESGVGAVSNECCQRT
jgi:hypothetical protein